ncbi:MAG: hypothetical protein HYY06_14130 [Deltaproteobacteria bacterium]|nr:hypothetical protein [Deltaproteobacteria bacterium]
MEFPLRSLVSSQLAAVQEKSGFTDTEFQLATFDAAVPIGAEAVAGSGVGLDHFAGERVLAGALLRLTPKGHEHRLALAVTDRRTALGGWSDIKGNFNGKRFSIPHTELLSTDSKTGLLSAYLGLVTARGKEEVPLVSTDGMKMLDGFYKTLLVQIPPEARVEPATPWPAPAPDDPAGARTAAQSLWFQDPAAARMLETLDGNVRAGRMEPAIAVDLVGRVVLAHRARAGGPGMRDGLWISPMSALDLGCTLAGIYGPPRAHGEPHPGVYSADFELDPRHDPLLTALDGLGVASYVVLGVGFSPTKLIGGAIAEALMRKDLVRQLRFVFGDRQGFCGYQVQTPGRIFEDHDAAMAHRLHQTLGHFAYSVLERRCALGWQPAYSELFARPAG